MASSAVTCSPGVAGEAIYWLAGATVVVPTTVRGADAPAPEPGQRKGRCLIETERLSRTLSHALRHSPWHHLGGGPTGRAPTAIIALASILVAALASCGGDAADGVDARGAGADGPASREEADAPGYAASDDWPVYGGDPGQRRFSGLTEVNRKSVSGLRRAWTLRTGVPGVFEATPIAVGGDLYLSTPTSGDRQTVLRVTGDSGRVVWRRELAVGSVRPHPTRANRGVAVGGGRVYLGTLDARVLALDVATGETIWESRTADPGAGYQHKQAPLYHDGTLYLGLSGGPLGIRGFVRALDAATGRERWRWHTIPAPEEGGWWGDWTDTAPGLGIALGRDLSAERADSARFAASWRRGGGAPWMTPTLDVTAGRLYTGVGNPAPELTGRSRPGDNLWTSSVCGVRAATGETAWCRQLVPHDRWGLDAASPPLLLPDGEVGHFSKLGHLHVFDRATGELERVSEAYVPQRNLLVRPTEEGVTMAPGIYGGTEWSPGAFSPRTGLAYTAAVHAPGRYFVRADGSTGFDLGPATERFGVLAAVDPGSGRIVWADTTEAPMVGGALATGGGLVFAGLLDGGLAAWDAETGELLWSDELPYGCASAPMTYRAAGRQHVAVACGGHFLSGGGRGDLLVSYSLP